MKLLTVIGARPQIIKAAAISRTARGLFADRVEERILHTGQHYDGNMSQVFFDELGIPQPHYNLGVGSGRHGEQTAKMIAGIEATLLAEHFDGVILYGDTNSTLAGAVAASKLHVPVYHVEAGLRSFNMAMPEEVNRIVCDQLSTICFAPTQTAVDNLRHEGFMESPATFADGRGRLVCNCGDVMYDNSIYFASLAKQRSTILQDLGLQVGGYILATVHRDNNTDNPFVIADSMIEDIKEKIVLVDFHAEGTSEKRAMGYMLAGRVSAVWGTHTHVQTSDACVLEGGTGYITDLGMTGAAESVLGIDIDQSIGKFMGDPPRRYESGKGACVLEGCLFEIDPESGKCTKAEAVRLR